MKIFRLKNLRWLLLVVVFIIIIITFINFTKDNDKFKINDHDLYQYFNGFRVDYKGKITINKTDDGITKINFDDNDSILDSTPLYYSDDSRVILPKNMAVIYPLEGTQYKVNYFTEAYIDFEEVSVKDKNLEKRLFDTILYDGSDLYFITDNSSITFGDKKYDVSPLSYVIVDTYNKVVSIFNYEKEEYTVVEDVNEEVIISNGKYKVNASLDLMYYDKTSKLFLKDVSKLVNLKVD